MLKAYLQAMAEVAEDAARRAADAARQALATSSTAGEGPAGTPRVDELAGQGRALVHELMARTRHQREALRDVVRAELESLLAQPASEGQASLAVQLAASQARVRELERALAKTTAVPSSGPGGRPTPHRARTAASTPRTSSAKGPTKATTKSAASKSAATKTAAPRAGVRSPRGKGPA